MSTTSQAGPRPARNPHQASTRHHVVDARFADILSEDFGIPTVFILDALKDEPQKQAISICEWASCTDEPSQALVAWSRKHNKGRCRRASRTADRPGRRHGEGHGTPRDDRRDARQGSGPARRRGVSGGLNSAHIRANVSRMAE